MPRAAFLLEESAVLLALTSRLLSDSSRYIDFFPPSFSSFLQVERREEEGRDSSLLLLLLLLLQRKRRSGWREGWGWGRECLV